MAFVTSLKLVCKSDRKPSKVNFRIFRNVIFACDGAQHEKLIIWRKLPQRVHLDIY